MSSPSPKCLSQTLPGRTIIINSILSSVDDIKQKLGELGLFVGIQVNVISNRIQTKRSSMIIELRGSQLILSRNIADLIIVEEI